MREILFRGKRVDNRQWVEGFVSIDEGSAVIHNKSGYHQVHPETVGQFTGLLDKNGKRIFEGDVLEDVFKPLFVKQLTGGAWGLDYSNGSGEKHLYPINQHIEIIGNIHDSPINLPTH